MRQYERNREKQDLDKEYVEGLTERYVQMYDDFIRAWNGEEGKDVEGKFILKPRQVRFLLI
jgi:hypothetical protein